MNTTTTIKPVVSGSYRQAHVCTAAQLLEWFIIIHNIAAGRAAVCLLSRLSSITYQHGCGLFLLWILFLYMCDLLTWIFLKKYFQGFVQNIVHVQWVSFKWFYTLFKSGDSESVLLFNAIHGNLEYFISNTFEHKDLIKQKYKF